jgi:hypothetical protein
MSGPAGWRPSSLTRNAPAKCDIASDQPAARSISSICVARNDAILAFYAPALAVILAPTDAGLHL